ncbi:hypothetical protein ADK60_40430, partial [Streptomyces sp. XY431]|uniref:hypothetical protein n=1 Tax=Streptomyces sp. XY431 TaxID=1415562 RepID=UPI0006AF6A86
MTDTQAPPMFRRDPELSRAVADATVLSVLPYRGETTKVVSSSTHGILAGTSVLGCHADTWNSSLPSSWQPFETVEAATAWQHSEIARMLRSQVRSTVPGFGTWGAADGSWAAEVDRSRHRYTAVVGQTVHHLEPRRYPNEPAVLAEERGWQMFLQVLPNAGQWPYGMAAEHQDVELRAAEWRAQQNSLQAFADKLERAAVAAELAAAAAEEAAVQERRTAG